MTPQVIEAAKYLINREQGAPAQHATIKAEVPPTDIHVNLVPVAKNEKGEWAVVIKK